MNTEDFITHFELDKNSAYRNTLVGLYFAFTTLSTVGFGDFKPRSDFERCLCSVVMVLGVATFSSLMGTFIDILGSYNNLSAEFDDGDTLTRFFGVLKHFNDEVPIDQEFQRQIEEFFNCKWNNDRNLAIS